MAEHDARKGIPYDAIVVRENSFESHESSLTAVSNELLNAKPRSKSLIRSAIKHLGISSKRKEEHLRDHDIDNTQVTESTMNTSGEESNATCAPAPKWNPKNSLLKQGEQLEIIDSDSDEDDSCATRSDQGDNCNKLNLGGTDTLKYDQVFHSSEHPMFRKTMDCEDDESADFSHSSPLKELKPRRWASIGKTIGRGRSLSVGRRKFQTDLEAKITPKNNDDDEANQKQLSKPTSRQSQKKQVKPTTKQSKLRSASVDTRSLAKATSKGKTSRSISVSRISRKKVNTNQETEFLPAATKPRKKKVKCIVCRQRLSKGQCTEHLDLYFCAQTSEQKSCFQCAKCHCELDQLPPGDLRVCNAQVMTNSRGSVVQW
jgi:hypothetical protein